MMTKAEIEKRLNEYKIYRKLNGVTKELYDAWCLAVEMADDMKDAEFVIKVGKDALDVIEGFILKNANASFEQLEEHAQAEKKNYVILARYYGVLRIMGKYDLDSFCLYVERNRPRKDRFYEPRRNILKPVADNITDLEYDRLDELYLHMPPRVGKLLADDTPVMTSEGWKNHGDLKVGDKVVGSDGRFTEVTHIFPKDVADYKVTLSDGSEYHCHGNHEWLVYDEAEDSDRVLETRYMAEHLGDGEYYYIPTMPLSKNNWIGIESIEKCEPRQGNCISVANSDGLYAVGKAMHLTHNSQLTTMATAWHCARNDELSNLYVTYVNSLGGAFVNGVLEIIRDPTYAFEDVFPYEHIANTDSTAHKMNLGRVKKYATLSGKGMDAALNGEYDASGWLILDDLHEGIQEVLNPDLMARKQAIFDNNVITRKKMGCKILGIGTLWSLKDIYSDRQDFLASNPKAKDIRWKVYKIPALNEKEESNFDYKFGVGFSTQYYQTLRDKFEANDDSASWSAQFMQEPVERSGVLFDTAAMKYYNGVLPAEEPVRITFACDVALGGEDYLAMPIAYVYADGSVYIHDVVYDNAEKKYTKPKVVQKIIVNNVGSGYFEANQGGEGYKDEVDAELQALGHKINLRSNYAPANKRKEQRIFDKAGSIREYYFRDQTCRDPEYRKFMNCLFSFSMKDKRKHKQDGAPDSLASLAYYLEGTWNTVRAGFNPFRRR